VVITLQQLPFIFNVAASDNDRVWLGALDVINRGLAQLNLTSIFLALLVCAAILIGSKFLPKIPFALITGNFDLNFLQSSELIALLPAAFAVATLAGLESLLSAKVADKMRGGGEQHNSDQELFGQGIANLVVPFFGGVPATAALARTAVNVRSHAQSKLAALTHAVILAIVILVLAPAVAQIPLAGLAGVLLATTIRMIKPSELMALAKESPLDALLLVCTFVATIAIDLISAVLLGIVILLALRKTKLAKVDRRYPPVDQKETLGD
jgi:SulP family sulfate permease